jgi:hypothetical protein
MDGALLHVAIAMQSGNVFSSPEVFWNFVRGRHRGNLARLTAAEQRSLVAPFKLETVSKTSFHSVCPLLYAETMGDQFLVPLNVGHLCQSVVRSRQISGAPFPFALGNGTFCTIHDITQAGQLRGDVALIEFCDFYFTRSALLSAAYWAQILEPLTFELIAQGESLAGNPSSPAQQYDDFSRQVCLWGGRAGIFNKLRDRGHLPKLHQWLAFAAETDDAYEAISRGVAIPELGVSFASKHLRFVNPARYATFDSLLAQAAGLPLDPQGYVEFLGRLQVLKEVNGLDDDIATLEMGLFSLIRPYFDAENLRPSTKDSARSDNMFASISPEAIAREFEYLGNFSGSIALYKKEGCPTYTVWRLRRLPIRGTQSTVCIVSTLY